MLIKNVGTSHEVWVYGEWFGTDGSSAGPSLLTPRVAQCVGINLGYLNEGLHCVQNGWRCCTHLVVFDYLCCHFSKEEITCIFWHAAGLFPPLHGFTSQIPRPS
jgi:hypothetical protein